MVDENKRWGGLLALALISFLAAPALGDEAAVGEEGHGYVPLGDEVGPGGTITITAPTNITGLTLVPGQDNTAQGNLTVTADAAWSVRVSDEGATTGGKMTEYNTTTGDYIAENPKKLAANMTVMATGVDGTDTYQALPVGGIIAKNETSGTGGSNVDVPVFFKQDISWSDPVSVADRGYKIVITFTGSLSS